METKKMIGIGILALGLGTIVYYLINRTREITASDKQNRLISFSTSYCLSGLNGTMNINLPAVSDAYYQDYEVSQNRVKLNSIKSRFGSLVDNISQMTKLSDSLIYSFIFIESRGEELAVSGKAIGLMQVGVNSATDIIFTEYKKGRLNSSEIALLQKHLGLRLNQIFSMKSPGTEQVVTSSDLFNPELNILIGCLYLGQLIDEHQENNSVRLDKVVTRYNMGYYSFSKGSQLIGDAMDIIAKVNPVTRAYITKLIGRNGILEMLEAEKCG